jgi:hypothetical protein
MSKARVLSLSGRLMGHFRPIVLVARGAVNNRGHDGSVSRRVTAKLVGDQAPWLTALPFNSLRKKRLAARITPGLDEDVDHITVLVDGPPEILLPTLDVHEQFVQVPGVAQPSTPASKHPGVLGTEGLTPLPNGLVGHGDTPLGQEILGISEAQTETVVQPDGMTDDRRWKSVSVVAGPKARHRPTLPAAAST